MSIMEANEGGFVQQHSQCESGTCTDVRQCQAKIGMENFEMGNGADFQINTLLPFNVKTEFWVTKDAAGPLELTKVKTIFS